MREVDIGTLDPDLRACIEVELASMPGSRVIKRRGKLFFKGKNGFEILLERLCQMKAQWVALVEHADLPESDKWTIFNMLLAGDARIEEVPGLGLKLMLPALRRH
jgi:hypothetical protein